jgi:hypothetical protein
VSIPPGFDIRNSQPPYPYGTIFMNAVQCSLAATSMVGGQVINRHALAGTTKDESSFLLFTVHDSQFTFS